jgi:rhodanese-related sulfurtransferase
MTQLPQASIPAVDVRTAHERVLDPQSGALLIDVREANEFDTVRAEGAVLMPMSTFAEHMAELPRDRPILVICQSGNRSGAVTAHLLRNGWTDVVNVAGGTGDWEKAGLPVRRGARSPGEGALPG